MECELFPCWLMKHSYKYTIQKGEQYNRRQDCRLRRVPKAQGRAGKASINDTSKNVGDNTVENYTTFQSVCFKGWSTF